MELRLNISRAVQWLIVVKYANSVWLLDKIGYTYTHSTEALFLLSDTKLLMGVHWICKIKHVSKKIANFLSLPCHVL